MEHSIPTKIWDLAILLVYFSVIFCYQGKAQIGNIAGTTTGAVTGTGTGTGTGIGTGSGTHSEEVDPDHIVAKALLCFNEKYIYSNCEESYRLTESGEINVPYDDVDEYCNGPCLTETHLVLDCIEEVMTNFEFYNKATIKDVGDTIKGACGHGPERGDFNVAEHIQAEGSSASKTAIQIWLGLGFIIVGHAFLP